MNNNYKEDILTTLKISYYFSYKDFKLVANLSFWPFFSCLILTIVFGLSFGNSELTLVLLYSSVFLGFVNAFVTRFYANSILNISKDGFKIIRNDQIVTLNWSDIKDIAFLTSPFGRSYLEIFLTIYLKDNNVEYIFIDSFYFKTAESRVKQIQPAIEKYFKNYQVTIQKSDFNPILLKKELGPPNVIK